MDLISEEGYREDGRRFNELRRIEISSRRYKNIGVIEFRQGNTVVMTMIDGPKESGKTNIKVKFTNTSRQEPINEKRIAEYEYHLYNIFNPIILSTNTLDITVIVKEEDGSLLSTMVNSISLCLSCSGVPLLDMCCSITLTENCVDLSSEEEGRKIPVITMVYLPNKNTVGFVLFNGKIYKENFQNICNEAMTYCKLIYEHIKQYLLKITENKSNLIL